MLYQVIIIIISCHASGWSKPGVPRCIPRGLGRCSEDLVDILREHSRLLGWDGRMGIHWLKWGFISAECWVFFPLWLLLCWRIPSPSFAGRFLSVVARPGIWWPRSGNIPFNPSIPFVWWPRSINYSELLILLKAYRRHSQACGTHRM